MGQAESTDASEQDRADAAVALVEQWLTRSHQLETRASRKASAQLGRLVADAAGVQFAMQFVDRVTRASDDTAAAKQLAALLDERPPPPFLNMFDKLLLRAGARVGRILPGVVMALARRRMRFLVGSLVGPAEPGQLSGHLSELRGADVAVNINVLGEAVLGEREAARRLEELLTLLEHPKIDYVSVKTSAIASQLNYWAHDSSVDRLTAILRLLFDKAAAVEPPTFVNFDMEEYQDLHLTVDAFKAVLSESAYLGVDAGIVLQAYLPDALVVLQDLVAWANERRRRGGGSIRVRLVKGANLSMEKVDAALHGWEQAPYTSKPEVDANYKRCVDWLLSPAHLTGVRVGLASHNLFDVAWTRVLSQQRGVENKVQFEMLAGMGPDQAAAVREATNPTAASKMLLYSPVVRTDDFDVAISYLIRRLEENASGENFLRHAAHLDPGSPAFLDQEHAFRTALDMRHQTSLGPRRTQDRSAQPAPAYRIGEAFANEPNTDPVLLANRRWVNDVTTRVPSDVDIPAMRTSEEVDRLVEQVRAAQPGWWKRPPNERQALLHRVGDELAHRRGDLIATMMHEASKTVAEADAEVSEAIDFARYYGDRATELDQVGRARFQPLGTIAVVSPWNFPVAIPAGGVLAGLAAGNTVLLKPAPQTPRCAHIVAQCCWQAGVPQDVLGFVQVPENAAGRRLITSVDGVILTGAAETADLFRSWQPGMRLHAETSGKNSMIITPNADLDLAVADLVKSAFAHSGQKCSAASLAILVGSTYDSQRFRRQLADAVESIDAGPSTRIESTMGPLIAAPEGRLERGLTRLDSGEQWLVEPRMLDRGTSLWSPGVRDGVVAGSWFHSNECFGPVLGLMRADDLAHAIEIQNSSSFGLTGGLHSLDPSEAELWLDHVQVGNAYINREITGAIVQRQPFGGWKRSSVGPGAKAGGPNYVAQLGTWTSTPGATDDYDQSWSAHFSRQHDPAGLFCEENAFRYRPLDKIVFRVSNAADAVELSRAHKAARICGTTVIESLTEHESSAEFARRLPTLGVERVRFIGGHPDATTHEAARSCSVHLADTPVTASGRIELQNYLREQVISRTTHRFGNLSV